MNEALLRETAKRRGVVLTGELREYEGRARAKELRAPVSKAHKTRAVQVLSRRLLTRVSRRMFKGRGANRIHTSGLEQFISPVYCVIMLNKSEVG